MTSIIPFAGLGPLIESMILLLNAMAILNERYFLKKCKSVDDADGWHVPNMEQRRNVGMVGTLKHQLIFGFYTMRNFGRCNQVHD